MTVSRNVVQFGPFTLDSDTRQLLREGGEVRLTPKAFELLHVLVTARPKAISKQDLQARLWPDAFVTEANLPGLVKEIRQALGDDPRAPRFIRTLHGFGYAFAAEGAPATTTAERQRSDATYWIVADRQIRLVEGTNILGRDPEATVWFDRPGVSRRHAQITIADDVATIEDLGSTNGTWLRGERLASSAPLGDGDEIKLGPVVLTFRVRRTAASTEVFDDL